MAVQIPFTTVTKLSEMAVVEDAFFTSLLQQCPIRGHEPQWLKDIRQESKSWLSRLQVPTKKDEDWRFIDLSSLLETKFIAVGAVRETVAVGGFADISETVAVGGFADISKLSNPEGELSNPKGEQLLRETEQLLPETENSRLVFVNGIYNAELSNVSGLPEGLYVGDLDSLPDNYPVSEYFAKQHGAQDAFTALNTTGGADIAVIWANKNVAVETSIHLIFISNSENQASFSQPRALVIAEESASISLIEEYIGTGEYFTNAVTEVYIKQNASVKHTRLQQESNRSFHIGKTAVSQTRDSHYTINGINLGGKLSRHNPEILQQGEQTETNLNGLTVITGEQTADTHSIVALTKPHGTTDQLHKCIVGDRGHSIFNGRIFVTKEAQLTDATQLNRNLLLSAQARVDTKPELQITADNVKCAHGATVSQLEADEIFYLRSRGLSEADSNQLLIDAFAAEIIDKLEIESLQTRITKLIKQKIKKISSES
jgi:Fe-S cluster assembly protein SufD